MKKMAMRKKTNSSSIRLSEIGFETGFLGGMLLSYLIYSPKNSLPALNKSSSRPRSAVSWIPKGSLSTNPDGKEIAGQPEIFAGTVKISARYIESGSDFSPNLNAGVGVVGVRR